MERWQEVRATGSSEKQARAALNLAFDAWMKAIESTEQVAESRVTILEGWPQGSNGSESLLVGSLFGQSGHAPRGAA
jgi:hypothetical protein